MEVVSLLSEAVLAMSFVQVLTAAFRCTKASGARLCRWPGLPQLVQSRRWRLSLCTTSSGFCAAIASSVVGVAQIQQGTILSLPYFSPNF